MDKKRAETNKSLRNERLHTDRALVKLRAAERAADNVVAVAREQADTVLAAARDRADQDCAPSGAIAQGALENKRARADASVESERALADDLLQRDRDETSLALAELLPLERELTDRNLLTERARSDQALASRDDFLGIVSHDLRNLLAGIVLSSVSLSKTASDSDEGRRIVAAGKRIQLYVARMNRLIGDLVDVASIDAGRLASTIVPGDPRALIAETLATFRRSADEKGIVLESEAPAGLPRAAFDYGRMLQVLANLVSNALKFTPRGGTIGICGERFGNDVRISVSDTGQGMPEDMFDSVFLRFWQAAPEERRGTGLGLYISKSLVEAHRGRIWVESKVGHGSVFHFTLPVVPPEHERTAAHAWPARVPAPEPARPSVGR